MCSFNVKTSLVACVSVSAVTFFVKLTLPSYFIFLCVMYIMHSVFLFICYSVIPIMLVVS